MLFSLFSFLQAKIQKYEMCIKNLQKENMLLIEELKNLEANVSVELFVFSFHPSLMPILTFDAVMVFRIRVWMNSKGRD